MCGGPLRCGVPGRPAAAARVPCAGRCRGFCSSRHGFSVCRRVSCMRGLHGLCGGTAAVGVDDRRCSPMCGGVGAAVHPAKTALRRARFGLLPGRCRGLPGAWWSGDSGCGTSSRRASTALVQLRGDSPDHWSRPALPGSCSGGRAATDGCPWPFGARCGPNIHGTGGGGRARDGDGRPAFRLDSPAGGHRGCCRPSAAVLHLCARQFWHDFIQD